MNELSIFLYWDSPAFSLGLSKWVDPVTVFLSKIFLKTHLILFPSQMVKNLPAMQKTQFYHWIRKTPWRREWLPTPVFLPGEFHGRRSLVGYSPWGLKELDMTEWLTYSKIYNKIRKKRYFLNLKSSFYQKPETSCSFFIQLSQNSLL